MMYAEPFRFKKPYDFRAVETAVRGSYNRVRYIAQSKLFGELEDTYYLPTYEEALDINKWAGATPE